ncbi:hypothetical protein Tco_1478724, partial [Tanacetum coccineum]
AILRERNTAHITPHAYTPSLPFLTTMEPLDTLLMGDEVISTKPARENDEFIKSSINDLVPIPRKFEVTSDSNLECDMPVNIPLPTTDFEDISSLDPPESTPVIDESTLLVTPPLASKQFSLREVERFDPFFSLTQSGRKTRVMETPSFGFYHMPSPRPAAYSLKEVMYHYYHPHLTSGDGFDSEIKSEVYEFLLRRFIRFVQAKYTKFLLRRFIRFVQAKYTSFSSGDLYIVFAQEIYT